MKDIKVAKWSGKVQLWIFFQTAALKSNSHCLKPLKSIHSQWLQTMSLQKRKKRWQTQRLIKKKKSFTMDTWIVSLEASCVAAEMPRKYVWGSGDGQRLR